MTDRKIAVVGATGNVGREILNILAERKFPASEVVALASQNSVGKKVSYGDEELTIQVLDHYDFKGTKIALFSPGGSISAIHAPRAAKAGCVVIDNTSHFRMHKDVPLIVPEVNPEALKDYAVSNIIANPNCSTIQMVVALKPLHEKYKVKRVVVSTYQSITGTGVAAKNQMDNERNGVKGEMVYPYTIDQNCLPHCDDFTDNGYTKEEMKLTNETKKILDPNINVSATAVRVPVMGGHSEALNIEFENDFELSEVRSLLHNQPGLTLKDDPTTNTYPMPLYAAGKNDVFVGRIRRDESQSNTLNMWVVADNLRKGAATNAVQIAELVAKLKC